MRLKTTEVTQSVIEQHEDDEAIIINLGNEGINRDKS